MTYLISRSELFVFSISQMAVMPSVVKVPLPIFTPQSALSLMLREGERATGKHR